LREFVYHWFFKLPSKIIPDSILQLLRQAVLPAVVTQGIRTQEAVGILSKEDGLFPKIRWRATWVPRKPAAPVINIVALFFKGR
jgi:hypothetical protein